MTSAVNVGLGRNGPWLQNDWLRVETRQADGSIAPVALTGAFRPTERAIAYVRLVGGLDAHFGRSDYDVQPVSDARGAGQALTLTSRDPRSGVTLRREIALYDGHPFCVLRLGISNDSDAPRHVESMHVFGTPDAGRGKLQLASNTADLRIYRNGWQSWSPTMSFGGAQLDVQSGPPVLAPEQPQRESGRFASDDVGVLFDPQAQRSMLAGAISARDMLTRIFIDAPSRAIDVRCLGDGVAVDPGETLWSERIIIDLAGTPIEQLDRYGEALGREMGARVPPTTPSGWCSWYYFYTGVTEDDAIRNLRYLESHRRDLPVDTFQIDDGYQADIGDWLVTNEKFPHGMAWLAAEVKKAGYTPGLWLAPFLLADTSRTYADHPDWVVANGDGTPALATDNWQRNNWALDGTHPDALAWLGELFHEVCDGWGYDYVKIDFLYAAALAGRRHEAGATRVQAYRRALAKIRETVGDSRFILGCGSLMAPSVGMFDGNRIGLDVAPFWRNLTTEERARLPVRPRLPDDGLSAEGALRNTLTRLWMHGRLWLNDPDCVLVRTDRTKLTLDETRTLVSVIGLSGGMMLVSDDMDKLPPERLELLTMLVPVLPHAGVPQDLMERDMPERLVYCYERGGEPMQTTALCNFDDVAKDLPLSLAPGRWHAFELWSERYLGIHEGSIEFTLVEPRGCRVVALRPATGAPCVVGTNAHIGVGAIDIIEERVGASRLDVVLDNAGRRERRLWIVGGNVASATVAGAQRSVVAADGAWAIDVDREAGNELTVTFE